MVGALTLTRRGITILTREKPERDWPNRLALGEFKVWSVVDRGQRTERCSVVRCCDGQERERNRRWGQDVAMLNLHLNYSNLVLWCSILLKTIYLCELILDRPGFKSLTWHGCSYFLGFISGFNGAMLSVVSNVVPTAKRLWWLCESRDPPAQFFGGAHRVGFTYVCS